MSGLGDGVGNVLVIIHVRIQRAISRKDANVNLFHCNQFNCIVVVVVGLMLIPLVLWISHVAAVGKCI